MHGNKSLASRSTFYVCRNNGHTFHSERSLNPSADSSVEQNSCKRVEHLEVPEREAQNFGTHLTASNGR